MGIEGFIEIRTTLGLSSWKAVFLVALQEIALTPAWVGSLLARAEA